MPKLYVWSQVRVNGIKYGDRFRYWMDKKEAWEKAGKKEAADKAQLQALKYCRRLLDRGYFEDRPGKYCLLPLFGLRWWEDVEEPFADLASRISHCDAERIRQKLKEREPLFEANLKKVEPDRGDTREEAVGFLRDQYRRLKTLLRYSTRFQDEIDCNFGVDK